MTCMAKVDYVSREMIRNIKPMDMQEFELPTAKACECARVQVSRVKGLEGGKFKCHVDIKNKKVIIARLSW